MKTLSIILLFAAAPSQAADVTVTVTDIKAKGGTVMVGLWDRDTFMRAAPPFNMEAGGKTAGQVTVRFTNVPPGDYAVNAFHDADDNRKLTMTGGRMSEGSALSNAEALRGPPSFNVNKVTVPAGETKISLSMSYPEDRQGW